ncbi:Free methionine-R-sulfoxide reductase [Smittium culicis]|uniref:Free methionine-R-sulfoxide reductase n=1 Tax=Smittium culicis TaxID=133412 RepID=A0A1R1X505_9FUNG|nr:Free methionine-R-sulfoxide reductase [Smittium culicis]
MANLSALVYHELLSTPLRKDKPVNWVGFYYLPKKTIQDASIDPKDYSLVLGPFQGKVACTVIKFGRGVCGSVAVSHEPALVYNVHDFKGHIACDSSSLSELVIPIILNGQLVGVFDLDCSVIGGFDNEDLVGIQNLDEATKSRVGIGSLNYYDGSLNDQVLKIRKHEINGYPVDVGMVIVVEERKRRE